MNRTVRAFIGLYSNPTIGEWIDVDTDPDATMAAWTAVHDRLKAVTRNPDPEVGVMDLEDWPGVVDTFMALSRVQAAVTVADYKGADVDAVTAFMDMASSGATDLWELGNAFEESYQGHHNNETEYAMDYAQETGLTENLGPLADYINWEGYARDFFRGDYWSEKCPTGGVYVFRSV